MKRNRTMVIVLTILIFLSIFSVTVFITSQLNHPHKTADMPCQECEKIEACIHLLQNLIAPAAFMIRMVGLIACGELLANLSLHTGVFDTLVSLKVKLTN